MFVLLGFHCWLRPAELLGLCWTDVVPIYSEPLTFGLVRVGSPKIKVPAVQHVLIECSFIREVFVLIRSVLDRPGHEHIFPWAPAQLAKQWQEMLRRIGLHEDLDYVSAACDVESEFSKRLTPAGLRAGGVTSDFIRTQSTSRTQWRGRWADTKVMRHYIQLGEYHLAGLQWKEQTRRRLEAFAGILHRFVAALFDQRGRQE